MTDLRGVLTALITPFTRDGLVDTATLREVVDRNIDGGVGAVVACGSTGEFTSLTPDERRLVVETVVDQTRGRVPVVAQTGAQTAAEAIALTRHARDVGASVVMLVTPYYEALTMDETLRYLRTVAGAVDIPVMLYNLPPATGVNLDPDTVGRLAREVPNIRYIKDTSADMSQVGRLIHHHGDVISTIVGWDSLALAALSEGAAGVMCGTANALAPELVAVHRALAGGDVVRARAEWKRIFPLLDTIMSSNFVSAVKATANARGFKVGDPREPLLPVDDATAARIDALVAELDNHRREDLVMTAALPDTLRTQAYVDGAFVDATDGATFESFAPATGQVIAKIAACTAADVDRAVAAARAAFDRGDWSRIDPADRKAVLSRFADLIEANAEELATVEAIDAGKPIADCRTIDVPDAINTLRWYAEAADKVFGKTSPTGADALGLIVREPVGVVGGVLPWNFPLMTLAWKIGPALATGNSLVIKPAELASLTTIRLAELATEAGIPAGVFNVVPGLGEVAGQAIGLHPDVDVVTFTGSTEIGRAFLRYSADSNLKGVVLECGGKSPQIVMADCRDQLDVVAADLADAAFWNAGQNCTAGSRILVDRSIKDEFVAALVAQAQQRTVGDAAAEDTVLGPLIEPSALDRVLGYVEQAKADGARVATGGGRTRAETGGWFAEATVLDEVTPQMSVAREEIFGPVVSVLAFDDPDEALRIANDSSYGLAATVWSKDIDVALRTARSVRAGTVAVNGYSEGDVGTPFGGYKTSGFGGRDKGLEALDQYTELKTIWMTLR